MIKQQLILCLFTAIFLCACVSTKSFLNRDQIPENFGKGTILIVEGDKKSINKAVASAFENYYHGKYVITGSAEHLKNREKYNYSYTFNTYSNYQAGRFTPSGREAPSTDYYFGVTDLKTNKSHKMIRYGNFIKFSKLYVQALEIARKNNE